MKRSKKGFTLVELIVVIAILAILAGVAIPVYSNYISKANDAADLQQLDAVKTAAVFAYTEAQVKAGNDDVAVEKITLTVSNKKFVPASSVKVNDDTTATDLSSYCDGFTFTGSFKDATTIYWYGGSWTTTAQPDPEP